MNQLKLTRDGGIPIESRGPEYWLIWGLEVDVAEVRQRLERELRSLGERLVRIANYIQEHATYFPNSLGEVQGAGSNADQLCVELAARRDALKRARMALPKVAQEVDEVLEALAQGKEPRA